MALVGWCFPAPACSMSASQDVQDPLRSHMHHSHGFGGALNSPGTTFSQEIVLNSSIPECGVTHLCQFVCQEEVFLIVRTINCWSDKYDVLLSGKATLKQSQSSTNAGDQKSKFLWYSK